MPTVAEVMASLDTVDNRKGLIKALLESESLLVRRFRGLVHAAAKKQTQSEFEADKSLRSDDDKPKLPEGAVLLEGDDAKAWPKVAEILKAKKLTPEALEKSLARTEELERDLASRDREKLAGEAAESTGYNAEALKAVVSDKNLNLEMREVEVELTGGKREKRRLPHVITGEGKDAKVERLTDFAEREYKTTYLAALKAGKPGGTTTAMTTATQYPTQVIDGRAADVKPAQTYVNQQQNNLPKGLLPKT